MEEVHKAERLNHGFEQILKFVDVMTQLDSFIADKTKSIIKKLASLAGDEDNDEDANNVQEQ